MPTRTPLANHNFPWLALPVSIASLIMICTLDSSIPLVHLHSGHLWRRCWLRRGLPRCFCFGTASTHSAISWVAMQTSSQRGCACLTGSPHTVDGEGEGSRLGCVGERRRHRRPDHGGAL